MVTFLLESASPSCSRGWRRRLQFRLRTLLIFTTLISVALGAWVAPGARQRRAVKAVQAAGGCVSYRGEKHYSAFGLESRLDAGKETSWIPRRYMPKWLPRDYYDDATVVECLRQRSDPRPQFDALRSLPRLETINLVGPYISDKEVQGLERLTQVRELNLLNTSLTSRGYRHLTKLTHIECMTLCLSDITDEGMDSIGIFPVLRILDLGWTRITDAGLAPLNKSV